MAAVEIFEQRSTVIHVDFQKTKMPSAADNFKPTAKQTKPKPERELLAVSLVRSVIMDYR